MAARSTPKRHRERGSADRAVVDAILDEGLVAHVGFAVDGQPFVIPMLYARDGDGLILHGAVASRLVRTLAGGVPACVTVTLVDGIVLARSTFHHSMNYRSVVAFGTARAIADGDAKRRALDRLVEALVPGRGADARGPDAGELAATEVLDFAIEEASAKVRTGPPKDRDGDEALPVWAGVVPLAVTAGPPVPAPGLDPGLAVPPYARAYVRGRAG